MRCGCGGGDGSTIAPRVGCGCEKGGCGEFGVVKQHHRWNGFVVCGFGPGEREPCAVWM